MNVVEPQLERWHMSDSQRETVVVLLFSGDDSGSANLQQEAIENGALDQLAEEAKASKKNSNKKKSKSSGYKPEPLTKGQKQKQIKSLLNRLEQLSNLNGVAVEQVFTWMDESDRARLRGCGERAYRISKQALKCLSEYEAKA